ncbi:glycosyltransferase [Fontisubflavum oceani]|uniref:glycosyltransferase n=1 Tax=Fontisubflavum oceani TaxID=2978973 RepID=UPI0025B4C352|nr:glycosyltransferase [Fontisubflavum oceani]WJY20964.1 glycosyltransferase [Fontisubflavum oceani]
MRKIGIFHSMNLGDNFIQGGVQKVCLNLVAGFDGAGWDSVMVQHEGNSGIREKLNEQELKELPLVFEIPTLNNDYGGLSKTQFLQKGISTVASILRLRGQSHKFDTVILNDITSIFFNKAFHAKNKYVFLHTERFANSSAARLALSLWPTGDVTFICPTNQLMDVVASVFPENPRRRVYTPVFPVTPDLAQVLPRSAKAADDPFRLCYIGRISPNKNIEAATYMAADISKSRKTVFDIYGTGFTEEQIAYEKEMQALAVTLNEDHPDLELTFKGRTNDPSGTFAQYDYSIILSDGEAIPLAGLESLSVGTAVIAWDAAGVNELVLDGVSGVVVEQDTAVKRAKVTPEFLDRLAAFKPEADPMTQLLSKFSIPSFVAEFE